MQATKKLLDITRDRRKTLKKEKEKWKMGKYQTTKKFFTVTFLCRKIYILLKYEFGKIFVIIVYLATLFVLQLFHMAGYWKGSFRYQHPYEYALVL